MSSSRVEGREENEILRFLLSEKDFIGYQPIERQASFHMHLRSGAVY